MGNAGWGEGREGETCDEGKVQWGRKQHQGGTNNGALKCHAALGSGWERERGEGWEGEGSTWKAMEEEFRGRRRRGIGGGIKGGSV